MATVLYCWELGGGIGHLVRFLPLAERLLAAGHRVVAALPPSRLYDPLAMSLALERVLAPVAAHVPSGRIEPLRTFAHILHNSGFGETDELERLVRQWMGIFDRFRPDVILLDHSPTALLAARGHAARKCLIGTGFSAPPNIAPLPDLRPWLPDESHRLAEHEAQVLCNANVVLRTLGIPGIGRVAQLYQDVDENLLLTFRELDPYPMRGNSRYWGCWTTPGETAIDWPLSDGPKVFAYLKPFPALPHLLRTLCEHRCRSLVYVTGKSDSLRREFPLQSVRFVDGRLDINTVASQCDLAVLNGTHSTSAQMLLAGKPMLQIPLFLEQLHNGMAIRRLGAGLCASAVRPNEIVAALSRLLSSSEYAVAAVRFRNRHVDHSSELSLAGAVRRVEELLQPNRGEGIAPPHAIRPAGQFHPPASSVL